MSEDDSAKFLKWAVSLGCPLENLPNEEYLKRIFRSNQRENLFEMMNRIRPKAEVKHIRDNIINKKIRKVDGQINTLMLPALPPALQRYTHIENLKSKIEHTNKSIKQVKFQIENLSKSIEDENRDYIQNKHNLDLSINRIFITESKIDSFIKHLKTLNEKKSSVEYILNYNKQVIGNDLPHDFENEKQLMNQCVENLSNNNYMEHYDQTVINHLKQTLNSITNINKWNLISTLSNDQIKLIKSMNDKPKFKNDNFRYTILLSKLYAEHIKIELKLKKTNIDCEHLNNIFETEFTNIEKTITKKFDIFNSSAISLNRNDFILNFIESIITKIIQSDGMKYLNMQNDIINNEIEQYENVLIENQNYVQTFDLIYNNIMKTIENIKSNSISIGSTNGKLVYSKKIADSLINEIFKNNKNGNFRKMLLNEKCLTTAAMESFYDDSILCSTKIGYDFESNSRLVNLMGIRCPLISYGFWFGDERSMETDVFSLSPMETTLVSSNQNNQYNFVQSQLAEYQLFNKLSFNRISYLPRKFNLLILSNQILNHSTNEILKKMFSNHLNTGIGVLEYVAKQLELYDLLKSFTPRRFDFEMPFDEKINDEINKLDIQTKLNAQKENLQITFNHVDGLMANLNLNIEQISGILDLLIENVFRKYIPATQQVNGHTYRQLENEFNIHV